MSEAVNEPTEVGKGVTKGVRSKSKGLLAEKVKNKNTIQAENSLEITRSPCAIHGGLGWFIPHRAYRVVAVEIW